MKCPLKVFTHIPTGEPMPLLYFNPDKMAILCVDEDGSRLCSLISRKGAAVYARDTLESKGFDTEWADWNHNGAFLRFANEEYPGEE